MLHISVITNISKVINENSTSAFNYLDDFISWDSSHVPRDVSNIKCRVKHFYGLYEKFPEKRPQRHELSCSPLPVCGKAWFPFELFVPFIARFGFSSSDFSFCFSLLFVAFAAFCCFSVLVVALSGFSLLLISTTFYRSRVEANE